MMFYGIDLKDDKYGLSYLGFETRNKENIDNNLRNILEHQR